MNARYPHLFEALQVGPVEVPNRFMTAAVSHDLWRMDPSGYNRWNLLGDRARAFYEERARGGFGWITIGQLMVHPSCGTNRPAAYLDTVPNEYEPIAAAIHAHGARVFAQINHNGRGRISGTDDWQPVLTAKPAPSFYPGAGGEFTKEIDLDEIDEIVEGFAASAANLERAGIDGVEVHAAHSYLLSEFLTPAYNRRTDEYGGSLANRMRFLVRVLEAVRGRVSSGFAVGIRLNAEWRIPDGFTIDDATEVARRLSEAALVDFINVSAWGYDVSLTNLGTPLGPLAPLSGRIRQAVRDTPICVVGRIVDADQAEAILAAGHADVVAMARAGIADPELPAKAAQGRTDETLRCIGASQGCIGRHYQHKPITCTQNPTVGREAMWGEGTLRPTDRPRRVVVVGGGPAGLETAVVAARRGHDVTLLEREDRLGGQVNLIVRNARRREFGYVVDWRRDQLARLGVDVRTGVDVDTDTVLELAPDVAVVATGSVPRDPMGEPIPGHRSPSRAEPLGIDGADQPHVLSVFDVLDGRADDPGHVVLLDAHGYYQSSDALEYLLARGSRVTALTTLGVFANDMIYNDRPGFLRAIRGTDVSFRPFTSIVSVDGDAVSVHDNQTGRDDEITGVDTVVISAGNTPINALYYDLAGRIPDVRRAGDCVTPRRVEHAHFEGHEVARNL